MLKSQKGKGHYDRFRSRIIFPIRDARGRVQGFGARALLPDQKPKYVNSPEGELYSKRRTLYGIERSRPQIVKSGRAVVVEGYTDVIACHQAQIRDAVAIMGTAITPEQVKLLSAYAEEAVLALDADRAGREAMLRAQQVAGARLRLRVARMPEGKDPADLLAGGDGASANAFRAAIDAAEDLPVFHVHTLLDDADLSIADGPRPSARRGRGSDRRDARLDHARGADARGRQPVWMPIRGWSRARLLERGGGGISRRRRRSRARARPRRSARRRGRSTRASGASWRYWRCACGCPRRARSISSGSTDDHFTNPVAARARGWLLGHLEKPTEGLDRADEPLLAYVTQVVMQAEREPASAEAMELSMLELEVSRVDAEIAASTPPRTLRRSSFSASARS